MPYHIDNTYWSNSGEHQLVYDVLNASLVPMQGEADTQHGNLLRSAANIYQDCYNNGGGNLDVRSEELDTLNHVSHHLAEHGDQGAILRVLKTLKEHRDQMGKECQEDCGSCNGDGEKECLDCTGSGNHHIDGNCDECDGNGTIDCSDCDGHGTHTLETGRSCLQVDTWEADLELLVDAVIVYVAHAHVEHQRKKKLDERIASNA